MKLVSGSQLAISGLILAISVVACGCGASVGGGKTPATPQEAMIQFTEAVHAGNEARAFAAMEATEGQKEFYRTAMQFLAAVTEFRAAFIKAYGEQAWRDFQDDSKGPMDGNATFTLSDPQEQLAKIHKLTFDIRGDEAFCPNIDGSGRTVRMIKVDGGWRIDANSLTPPEAAMKQTMGKLKPMVELVRKYKKAIGHAGIKPEDIDAELGRDVTQALTGFESHAPRRFEIDKL